MKKILISLFLFTFFISNASDKSSKFNMEGYLNEIPVLAVMNFNAKPGSFDGLIFYASDIEEFGYNEEMGNVIKGNMDNNGNIVFQEFFYGQNAPFGEFKGFWGETSDGEGIHGELKTLSIGSVEELHLYFLE